MHCCLAAFTVFLSLEIVIKLKKKNSKREGAPHCSIASPRSTQRQGPQEEVEERVQGMATNATVHLWPSNGARKT